MSGTTTAGESTTPRTARRETQAARRASDLERALQAQRTAQALMATGPVPSARAPQEELSPEVTAATVGESASSEPLSEEAAQRGAAAARHASEVPEGTERLVADDAATEASGHGRDRTESAEEENEGVRVESMPS